MWAPTLGSLVLIGNPHGVWPSGVHRSTVIIESQSCWLWLVNQVVRQVVRQADTMSRRLRTYLIFVLFNLSLVSPRPQAPAGSYQVQSNGVICSDYFGAPNVDDCRAAYAQIKTDSAVVLFDPKFDRANSPDVMNERLPQGFINSKTHV